MELMTVKIIVMKRKDVTVKIEQKITTLNDKHVWYEVEASLTDINT